LRVAREWVGLGGLRSSRGVAGGCEGLKQDWFAVGFTGFGVYQCGLLVGAVVGWPRCCLECEAMCVSLCPVALTSPSVCGLVGLQARLLWFGAGGVVAWGGKVGSPSFVLARVRDRGFAPGLWGVGA